MTLEQTQRAPSDGAVHEVAPSSTVEIHLPDGRVLEGRRGMQLEAFLADSSPGGSPILGAIVNGLLRELTIPVEMEAYVQPLTMDDADGMRIYRRSLTFLLAAAFEVMFADARLNVDHSVASGGYFCQVSGRPPLSVQELSRLEERMKALVAEDLPFAKMELSVEEAMSFFRAKGYEDKVRLLAHRRKPHMVFYKLGDHRELSPRLHGSQHRLP